MIKHLHITLSIMLMSLFASAQTESAQNINRLEVDQIGQTFLTEKLEELNLTDSDILGMHITDLYINSNNGWTQLYYNQTYKDVQVNNAILNLTIKPSGKVVHYGNRFVNDIRSKIESDVQVISAADAIVMAAKDLELPGIVPPTSRRKKLEFQKEEYDAPFAAGVILAQPKYIADDNGLYRLTWEIYLDEIATPDTWFSYIDAATGEVISKRNNTVFCQVHNGMFHNHTAECRTHKDDKPIVNESSLNTDGASYRVYQLPIESPAHGLRELIVDPANPEVSPYGWHDVDGEVGAEFTITRGNNVWAYADLNASNTSSGDEPDGGADLVFDFDFVPELEPIENVDADVTNLFVACNIIHDNAALVGFDAPSGNFQENNYGSGGRSADPVRAETLDGSGTNNATFGTPPDGASGTMQMFQWDFSENLFRVLGPGSVAGEYANSNATWGMSPDFSTIDVSAEMAIARDASIQNASRACGEIVSDVEGKIAMIFRGTCEFGLKALNAENAGAVAAIICNVPGVNGGDGEGTIGLGAGDFGDDVTIPVLSLGYSDCVRITDLIDAGTTVTAQIGFLTMGPSSISSGFDNGVIAHEFGHGIHNRLGGGPASAGCFSNDEQMGEGIADYFTLVMTAEAGDTGADARGVGAFLTGGDADGRGIRRFPYSTDMNINPITLDDIKGTTAPHPLGEVWTAVMWDLYWEFVELYGFSEDWGDDTAGNVRAVQLAIDGMKMAPCNPGFLDMRDAVLAADDAEHECLIWEVFARRGMGYFADQGDVDNREDGVEDFEPLPTCIPTLKINKTIQELVVPGEEIEVTLVIANHTGEVANNTIITDIISDGLTYVDGSASIPASVNGNMLILEVGDFEPLGNDLPIADGNMTVTYRLQTDPNIFSTTKIYNSVEIGEPNPWELDIPGAVNTNFWTRTAEDANEGEISWVVREVDADSDQRLVYSNINIVSAERATVRFWHRINCTAGENGGFIEYSTDGQSWFDVRDRFILGEYTNPITFNNLAMPDHMGYSGFNPQGDFQAGYLNFSDMVGQDFSIRFRFSTHDFNTAVDTPFDQDNGWFIDDFEVMDLKSYFVQASISADNADEITDGEREIIIDSDRMPDGTSTDDILLDGVDVELIPNPASDNVTVRINSDRNLDLNISLVSIEGREVYRDAQQITQNQNIMDLDISNFASGFYMLQINSEGKVITEKLIIE